MNTNITTNIPAPGTRPDIVRSYEDALEERNRRIQEEEKAQKEQEGLTQTPFAELNALLAGEVTDTTTDKEDTDKEGKGGKNVDWKDRVIHAPKVENLTFSKPFMVQGKVDPTITGGAMDVRGVVQTKPKKSGKSGN